MPRGKKFTAEHIIGKRRPAREKSLDVEDDPKIDYPRQGSNKRSLTRRKPEKGKSPGANSGTTKRSGRRGATNKANGRKGGAK